MGPTAVAEGTVARVVTAARSFSSHWQTCRTASQSLADLEATRVEGVTGAMVVRGGEEERVVTAQEEANPHEPTEAPAWMVKTASPGH